MAAARTRAEMALLGAVLIDPDCIETVAPLVAPAAFGQPRLRLIYEAMLAIHARGERADYVAVLTELEDRGTFASVGLGWVTHLVNECPCSLYAEHYARLVQRGARRRDDPLAVAGRVSIGLAL